MVAKTGSANEPKSVYTYSVCMQENLYDTHTLVLYVAENCPTLNVRHSGASLTEKGRWVGVLRSNMDGSAEGIHCAVIVMLAIRGRTGGIRNC